MDKNSQIDNVQSFVKVIGDNDNLWNFLLGREVIDYWGIRGKIVLLCDRGKGSQIRVDLPITVRDSAGARDCVRCKFFRIEEFIIEFNKIVPPLYYEEIYELMQAKKREVERHATKIRDEKKREVERHATEIRDEKKRELEKQEAKRKEIVRRRVERQGLLMSLKEQFEQSFLNADNFYQAQCTKRISFQEYQAEKFSYVQSWVKTNLNSSPDLPQQQLVLWKVIYK